MCEREMSLRLVRDMSGQVGISRWSPHNERGSNPKERRRVFINVSE